jgi:D-3-phosphoglycerate dehydrogenase
MADARPLVVVAGDIHPDGLALLEREARVVVCTEEQEGPFCRVAADADAILLIVNPRCTEGLLSACKHVRVVGRHGAGLDTIDIPAATRLGVAVVHAPGSNSQAVAEHALMMMLSLVKRSREIDGMTRAGDWSARTDVHNTELGGKTLGIVGVGNIGRRVAKFADALGMRVLGYDPYVAPDELRRRGADPVATLEAMLPQCDVVTVHAPLTDETRGMFDGRAIALMKPGAIFVNTARGPIQVEADLFEALTRRRLAAAGLDVWEQEPTPLDNPLLNLPNVICSTHIAGVTLEAKRQMAVQVGGEMLRVLRGERPDVLVNEAVWSRLRPRR